MNPYTPQNTPPVIGAARATRYGLIKIAIGSAHMVRGKDGVMRSYTVRERDRFLGAKVVARCLTCRADAPTEAELIEQHPERHIMERQAEKHVYGLWSDEPVSKDEPKVLVGLLSDQF